MALKVDDVAISIHEEATKKYDANMLIDFLEGYNYDMGILSGIVDYFKEKEEKYPHLEAFEIYLVVEENLEKKKPTKVNIKSVMDGLFGESS